MAFRKADKLGVQFWDMYGTLTAYNVKKISSLHMSDPNAESIRITNCEAEELTYSEHLNNFQAGCADDDVWAELR